MSELCHLPSLGQWGQRETASVSWAEASHMGSQALALC